MFASFRNMDVTGDHPFAFSDGDYKDAGCKLQTGTKSLNQKKHHCNRGVDGQSLPVAPVLQGFLVDPLPLSSPEDRREARVNCEISSYKAQGTMSLRKILSQ